MWQVLPQYLLRPVLRQQYLDPLPAATRLLASLVAPETIHAPGPEQLCGDGNQNPRSLPPGWRTLSSKAAAHRPRTLRTTDDQYDKHHRVNDAIFQSKLLVEHPEGHRTVMSRKDALKAAAELDLDLVEFKAPDHLTPVAKILDYEQLRSARRESRIRNTREAKASTHPVRLAPTPAQDLHAVTTTDQQPPVATAQAHSNTAQVAAVGPIQGGMQGGEKLGAGAHQGLGDVAVGEERARARDAAGAAAGMDGAVQRWAGAAAAVMEAVADGPIPKSRQAQLKQVKMEGKRQRREQHEQRARQGQQEALQGQAPLPQQQVLQGRQLRQQEAQPGAQPQQQHQHQAQQQGQQQQQQQQQAGSKVKVVTFSPHIAAHDIQTRLRKVKRWLEEGLSVSLSQEVDSTGSTQAAELALDSLVQQLAGVGVPRPGKRVQSNLVAVMLRPVGKEPQPASSMDTAAAGPGGGGGGASALGGVLRSKSKQRSKL